MNPQQWAVRVGTDPETAKGKYREFAGSSLHGPFTYEEALLFKESVVEVWANEVREDPSRFVYGTPFAELEQLQPDPAHPFYARAAVAAGNWYLGG